MGMALVFVGATITTGWARQATNGQRVAVTFEGGHETDPRDRGRPVVLVAGALGVTPETFREAFSRVHPAHNGGPTPEQARQNKSVLLGALSKYGITNDRLDEVSNRYRYRRDHGEMWPTRSAKAFAIVRSGQVVGFEVTDGGDGYSSAPTVTIPGFPNVGTAARLSFDRSFEKNGAIQSISLLSR